MSLRRYPTRLLAFAALSSLTLIGLSGMVSLYLYREQGRTADSLQENIGSRGAAINLEVTLHNLAALHERQLRDVEPLLEQVQTDLNEIERFADKVRERELVHEIVESFGKYSQFRREGVPPGALAELLREQTIPKVEALRVFNGLELRQSEEDHRRSLRLMAWGLTVVGILGSAAGMFLGYGLARGMRRTIHQFLVQIQGASDLLGQEVSTIEWQRPGDLTQDAADGLLNRVEQTVLKLQQREREIRRAERMAALGQLAAGVAHEIRNPLTSAILLLETSRKDPSAGRLTDEDLDLIVTELHRIEQLLQQFLDYARPPTLERTDVDVGALIEDVLNLVRGRCERQRVEVKFNTVAKVDHLDADREQLRQVFVNLILNALDVMPNRGILEILMQEGSNEFLEIIVADSGPGIAPDIQPRLFEPFASGKKTGLGLGLVVSRRIIEDHGGTIQGANRLGGGAKFVLRLPRAKVPKAMPMRN